MSLVVSYNVSVRSTVTVSVTVIVSGLRLHILKVQNKRAMINSPNAIGMIYFEFFIPIKSGNAS